MTAAIQPAGTKEARIAIVDGLGLNCGYETKHAFEKAGAKVDRILINRLMEKPEQLDNYDMLVFQGGFSAGDHLGSGKYVAKIIEHNKALFEKIQSFAKNPKKLIMGICNGFQILTNLGLLPGALSFNEEKVDKQLGCRGQANPINWIRKLQGKLKDIINPGRYQNRWVDLKVANAPGPWFKDVSKLSLPIAHGEGRYVRAGAKLDNQQIALQYRPGLISASQDLSYNPNGSEDDIAAVTNEQGNVLGMMPHPERAIYKMHEPDWQVSRAYLPPEAGYNFDLNQTTNAFKVIDNVVKFLQAA